MNRSASYLIIVAVLACLPYAAFGLVGPHDPLTGGRGYTCFNCHTANTTLGTTGYDNVCLTCHKPGAADPLTGRPMRAFTAGDFANPFGTFTGARPAVKYQTSHKWTGTDTVPKAGALPPLDPYNTVSNSFDVAKGMNKKPLLKTITCARCHNVHNDSAYTSVDPPFLRSLNDKDQMCLDCHRPRNSATHLLGSHPVNVSYTSARVKGNPAFKKDSGDSTIPPRNLANRTAEMKIKSGLVLCTTCHGIHYSDSNSRTFDSYSSAIQGKLSTSQGFLLRTDLRGPTASSVNICSNCHNKPNHNKRGQNIQCSDCHAGHVDVADGSLPNVYVVRRYMNISTSKGAVRNSAAFYQYTGSNRNWKNANLTKPGVCQSCHAVPTGGSYPPEHADASGSNGRLCMGCHVHDAAEGAFSASCTSCHGYPPRNNVAKGPRGWAQDGPRDYATSGAFKNESTSGHVPHAGGSPYTYSCYQCHNSNSHNAGTFQDVFVSGGTVSGSNGVTPAYNPATGTCTVSYCHSNGAPSGQPIVYKTPQWANARGSIIGQPGECSACHDATPATNAHTRHVSGGGTGKAYACSTCHSATVNSSLAIIDTAKHVNGVKDLQFSGSIGANLLAGTSCGTVYCHSNGRGDYVNPTWTTASTGACGSCHAATPALGGNAVINSNGHFAHLSSSYGPKFSQAAITGCQNCHTSFTGELAAGHVNGTIDVGGAACNTCHANGIIWQPGRLVCTSCHDGTRSVINGITAPAISQAQFASKGHGQYNSYTCVNCHNNTSRHINGGLGDKRLVSALGSGSDNTECTYCHNDGAIVTNSGRKNMSPHLAQIDGSGNRITGLCNACHTPHGTSNLSMLKTTINGRTVVYTNVTTAFISKVAVNGFYNGICQVCHTKTSVFRNTTTSAAAAPSDPDGGHYADRNCLDCHDHQNVTFAFAPIPGGCAGCHGYPPKPRSFVSGQGNYSTARYEDYSGGGGAHVRAGHIKPTAMASEKWANCTPCHISNQHAKGKLPLKRAFVNISVPSTYRFNVAKKTGYSGDLATTAGSCSNVSCHFQTTPKWDRP